MKVKLLESIAGDRFSFRIRDVVECSDDAGERLIAHGIATEAPKDAETAGRIPESGPPKPRAAEIADIAAPEAAVTRGGPAHCNGKTHRGNPCLKAPVPGEEFCVKHRPLPE